MSKYEEKIDLSLILPSLNVANYIEETLKSACEQSLENLEIICVDAGSTDGTTEIIEKFRTVDPRIKLLISNKRSYGYQVNLGIKEARGKYLAILETDDFVDYGMYEKLFHVAEEFEVDYVKADYDTFFSQDDGSYYFSTRHTFSNLSLYDSVLNPREHVLVGRDDWYLWQGIYSSDFIRKNNICFSETPGAAFQDIGFLFWTGAYAEKAVYLRNVFYHYRIDRDNASSNVGKGVRYAYDEYYAIIEKLNDIGVVDKDIRSLLYARMIKSFVSGYSRIDENQESAGDRKAIYEWFKNEISYALQNGYIDDSLILSGHLNRLKLLLQSEEEYFKQYSTKGFDEYITARNSFAVFGCGDFGFKAYRILRKKSKNVVCFFDNNSDLLGKTLNGLQIKHPNLAMQLPKDVSVVVANEAHFNEMRDQLLNLGIDIERIVIFQ